MQKILNLIGDDSLIGNLALTARKLGFSFEIVDSNNGREYIESLHQIYEFGEGLHPEIGYSFRTGHLARAETFDNIVKFELLINDISRNEYPICIFNHISEHPWTYVFVLHDPSELGALFKAALPADYFISDTQGTFLAAANWHHFSYVV